LQSFPLLFYPGTELYHRALKEGLIKKADPTIVEENMQEKRACYMNFLFSLAGILWFPRWIIQILSIPLLVKIGSFPIFDRGFGGIYWAARHLKTVFFHHPSPKDLVINMDVS
jgi:hypothetical protein